MRKKEMSKRYENIAQLGETSYHQGQWSGEAYAFNGYNNNWFYTSDRKVRLNEEFKPLDKNGRLDEKRVLKGFGIEFEEECWSVKGYERLCKVLRMVCFEELDKDLFKFNPDGSLRDGLSQAEAITQVMSKEYIRNNYPGFKKMYEYFKEFLIDASRSGNCGMHVNMSNGLFGGTNKLQQEAIKKFIYIVNTHFRLMCVLFKRDYNHSDYCGEMSQWLDKDYAKSFDLMSDTCSSHGVCFNYAHFANGGRVELRLVGGQKDYYTFRNTMECIFHLVSKVKEISWDNCDNVVEIFKGCNKYVIKRLMDVKLSGLIRDNDFNEIVRLSDIEFDLGNF